LTTERYDLHVSTPRLGQIHAADVAIQEEGGAVTRVGFRYRDAYLSAAGAFPLCPVQLPLSERERILDCRGAMPGFLDDYLPDRWGRRVLARLAFYRDQRKVNFNSAIDTLALLSSSRIGAISLAPRGAEPVFDLGSDIDRLATAELAAQHLDDVEFDGVELDEMSLLYLANAGTGVGGARPKALLHDAEGAYLAKFNRKTQDAYNNARVELACLLLARKAGLEAGGGRIQSGINGREVLLLDRFDLADGGRHHLVTANALLKDPSSQADVSVFRYDDVFELLRSHSIDPKADLQQLLRLMLFNRAINNTDDHERNFSLINRGDGYRLSPAYDLVPSLTVGEYHAAGYGRRPDPPAPAEITGLGRVFNLPRPTVASIAEQVAHAVRHWPETAASVGVSEQDIDRVGRVLRT